MVFCYEVTFAWENSTALSAVTRQFKSKVAAWPWPNSRYLAALWLSSVPKESFFFTPQSRCTLPLQQHVAAHSRTIFHACSLQTFPRSTVTIFLQLTALRPLLLLRQNIPNCSALYSIQWRTEGGVFKPLLRNFEGPPKSCQNQPDCENC